MKRLIFYTKSMMRVFTTIFLVGMGIINLTSVAMAGDVSVYAEGAYTNADLTIYVYADIPAPLALVSMGVKVNYDSTKLSVASMEKNQDVWYFGTSANKFPYKDPEDTGNAVVIIGGKLDTNAPTAGVTGDRVLLGKIVFNRSESGDPGSTPEDYFGISLDVGKGGTFANFVDTDGNELDDGVMFSVIVRERGDANGDGLISSADMFRIRSLIGGNYIVFADCNGDGLISSADMFCVRNKI